MKKRKSLNNLPASVRQRLLNVAKQKNQIFDLILTCYALERLLYRLSQSAYKNRFILKGAMLFVLWIGESHRPTRDLDLLGHGDSSQYGLLTCFRELCELDVEPDGLFFDAKSVSIHDIREDQLYQGQRIQNFVWPILDVIVQDGPCEGRWLAGGSWVLETLDETS